MVMFLVINVITESLGQEGRRIRVIDGMTIKWRPESMKKTRRFHASGFDNGEKGHEPKEAGSSREL